MGLIPFLGNDSEKDEDGFNNDLGRFADNTELSRGEQKESNKEVAEMHKSRSRKAFEENEQFTESSGEWRKVTDSENSFSETDTGPDNFQNFEDKKENQSQRNSNDGKSFQNSQSMGERQSPEDLQEDSQSREDEQGLKEGLEEMDETLQNTVEQASQMKEEFAEENVEENNESISEQEVNTDNVNDQKDSQDDPVSEKDKVADSLEQNISEIKKQIESDDVSRKGLEDIVSRFEELVDRLEGMNSSSGNNSQVSSDFKEDVREDLSSFQDELLEMREKQETLDSKYSEVENAVVEASEGEEDVRVEDINTVERLDNLEKELDEIKSGEVSGASDQVHMEALENEVKELRKDVRELSEAVVTISEKVFR